MANYVLVHGGDLSADTWNKLTHSNEYPSGTHLGKEIWKGTIAALEAKKHRAFALTLADANTHNLTYHINQVISLIIENGLQEVILVGHSYSGMVITGVAAKIPERLFRLVYLDAAFPDSGQSLYDLMGKKVIDGAPIASTEKLYYDPKKLEPLSKACIICTKSDFASLLIPAWEYVKSEKDWIYLELPTGHVPQATMPKEFAQLLLQLGNHRRIN